MATNKEIIEKSQKQLADFFALSKYLLGEEAPFDINEMPEDSPYYELARDLADEMGLDWKNMSHDDSNRLVINLLSEYYMNIQIDEGYSYTLSIKVDKK